MSKVSVIIPVYNSEKYLRECLDSVIGQTLEDIEIICVNDGSTDGSKAILYEYAACDSRVKVLNQENKGAGEARQFALEVSNGEYIAFLDSDDWYSKNYLLELYNKATVGNFDIVKGGVTIVDSKLGNYKRETNAKIQKELETEKIPYSSYTNEWGSSIYKKELINKYEINFPKLRYHEDMAFLYKVLSVANSFSLAESAEYFNRINQTSLTHKKYTVNTFLDFLNCRYDVFCHIEKYVKDKDLYKKMYYGKFFNAVFYDLTCYANHKIFNFRDFKELCDRALCLIEKTNHEFYKNNKNYSLLKNKEYKKLAKLFQKKVDYTFLEKIFSVKNEVRPGKAYKVICIFGVKLKLRKKGKKSV